MSHARGESGCKKLQKLMQPTECNTANLLISEMDLNFLGKGISSINQLFREDQGTRERVKIGQEEPNQSDNISVAAAPFPMQNSQEVF